ncbi:LysE family translocator [Croceiramulus getboli]|nr:LysE family transporter [Flavobacteriaceae bacterium YJPT1-3]
MILLMFSLGVMAAVVGALPLGAVNLMVMQTTMTRNLNKGLQVALAAGIGEVVLVGIALLFSMEVLIFFDQLPWLQPGIAILFIAGGIFFLLKKAKQWKRKTGTSAVPYFSGLILALLNPPVILYWLLFFALLHDQMIVVDNQIGVLTLSLFFLGIYLGKVGVLYGYARWSDHLKRDGDSAQRKLFRIVGTAFILLGVVQMTRLLYA